jgi:hypothetical protein
MAPGRLGFRVVVFLFCVGGVTHEKFVGCTSPLNQVGQYVRLSPGTSDRSAKGLKRSTGQSLRALGHIMPRLMAATFLHSHVLPQANQIDALPEKFVFCAAGGISRFAKAVNFFQ